MSNYMDEFARKMEDLIYAMPNEGDQSQVWMDWRDGLINFVKERVLESYKNGLRDAQKRGAVDRKRPTGAR